MPTIVADLFIRTAVHFVHELYRLFFHQLSGMEVTLARNFHGTVAKAALDLLDQILMETIWPSDPRTGYR